MAGRTLKKDDVDYPLSELWRDLWSYVSPYRGPLAGVTAFLAVSALAQLWPWYAISRGVTELAAWKAGDPVWPIMAWFASWIGASLVRSTCSYLGKRRGIHVADRAGLDVREAGQKHLLDLDIAWHERENAGNKLERITAAANGVARFVRFWVLQAVELTVALIGSIAVIATVDPAVSVATLLFLAVFFPTLYAIRRKYRVGDAVRAVNRELEQASGATYESLNNVRTAKVLDMTGALIRIVRGHLDSAGDAIKRRVSLYQGLGYAQGVMALLFKGCAVLYIVFGVMQGRYEVGFVLLFHGYFNRLTDMAVELADASQELEAAKIAMSRMSAIFRTPPPPDGAGAYPLEWKAVSLQNVGYAYAGRKVLRGVSFDIKRGERVGIVGLSGAGKSTLFKLLLKELEDYTGEILVDGVPLRDIKREQWYRHAAVVLQETEVFNFPLRQNVSIAARDGQRDHRRLKRALDVAHVTEFLGRLPQGVETMIGEKGVKLSGGERQRVGIARAVFKEPDILFLDEATSHLDLESEERIRDSLHEFFQRVTAVVIAHRLTTIKEMDRIVVLEKGRLIEQGSFEELMALKKGRFRGLWDLQKLG